MLGKSQVKYIQSLGQKKHRDEEGVFVVEGPKIIEEWLSSNRPSFIRIYALSSWINANNTTGIETIEISGEELGKISQQQSPNQVLAIIKKQASKQLPATIDCLTLALDTIQDPGNLGTILRIADWFGIKQVVCSTECADMYNPKVVQAAMGSLFRVDVFYTSLATWLPGLEGTRVYAATLAGQAVQSLKTLQSGVIVIGNESKGISPEVLEQVNVRITIPRIGSAESLNAAVATGIILSHVTS